MSTMKLLKRKKSNRLKNNKKVEWEKRKQELVKRRRTESERTQRIKLTVVGRIRRKRTS